MNISKEFKALFKELPVSKNYRFYRYLGHDKFEVVSRQIPTNILGNWALGDDMDLRAWLTENFPKYFAKRD